MNDPLGFTEYRKSQIRLKAVTEIPVSKVIQLQLRFKISLSTRRTYCNWKFKNNFGF